MSSPSASHSNRKSHNWLIYEYMDLYLEKAAADGNIRGILYDLGCGETPYRDWFLQYADNYIGIDWPDTLHKLKADIVADLNKKLPVIDETADTVISLSVMEHLQEPQQFLDEAYRIINRGGTIVLQVPFMWWVHEEPHDYFRYTRHGLRYMFEKAGFSNIEIHPQTGFWAMWVLKFNYQSVRLIRYLRPKPIRMLMVVFMHTAWAINQRVAPWLDKYWNCETETAGYFVIAKKTS